MKALQRLLTLLFLFLGAGLSNVAFAQCTAVPGSIVQTPDGAQRVYTCPGDGEADIVEFTNNATGTAPYAYVITDNNNIILAINVGNEFDFEPTGSGTCRVFGFSYNGTITAQPGDLVYSTRFSDDCWYISNNAIEVVRDEADGGMVSLVNGGTSYYACLGDGNPDIAVFTNNSASNSNYAYVITDDNNNILGLPAANFADFAGVPVGICRVWGLAYTGNIIAQIGDNAASVALADGCFDLSDNFITVDRNNVDGGQVAMPSGAVVRELCSGDGTADIVNFTNNSSSSADYAYVITDDNNIILAVNVGTSFDFDVTPAGVCRVFGFSYTGTIMAQPGDLVYTTRFSDGCYLISSNAITVYRRSVDGGTVAMPSGATTRYTCPGDGVDDIVMFAHTTSSNANYAYVITDDNNNILGIPPGNSQNFEGAGEGICRVWGLSYTGNITAQPGDNAASIALSDDCFDLSENFITIIRSTPDGGTVNTTSGETTVNTCPGDGIDDIIDFAHTTNSDANYAYVITDDNNIILGIPPGNSQNFEGAGDGICRVWGLSYTGAITAQPGDDAAAVALSNDCFDLSDNFITVIRSSTDGGTVAMPSGATTRYTCPGDGVDDIIMFTHTTTSNANYAYVITDDNNNILGIPPGNSQNFEGAGEGICRVWGLSYTGNITAQQGDNAAMVDLSDGCFDLSENFITVIRSTPDGGTVSTPTGETSVNTCAGDGIDDIINFAHVTNSDANYAYVITDDNNIILGIPPGDSQNFEGAGGGVCRVWGLSYTGSITAQPGDDAAAVALSDDCFDLSDNFITVNREEVDGGTVAMPSGETTRYTCPGDGVDDIIMFTHTTTSNANYAYVITDDNNNILGLPPGNSQNFEGAGEGICRVWGLSYTGNITAQQGDNAAMVDLSDGCFQLSDNFITVIRSTPDGGMVSTQSGETAVNTCAGDGVDDIIDFAHTTNSAANYAYVITDDNNIILGIPPGNSQNFEGAGGGVCRVWGLSYTGSITAQPGDDAAAVALSDDCFDLSDNFITVNREEVDGGTVSMPSGATTRYTCPGDGVDDIVMFTHNTTSNANYAYVITDDNNNILGLPPGNSQNFEGAGEGICRVWGLSYTGNITAQQGDNAAMVDLSDGCFQLSDNFIEIIRSTPDGGTVAMPSGATTRYTCPGDGIDDIVMFTHNTASDANYAYVITDDNNNILGLPPGNSQNFEGAGEGVCRVWGLSYTGSLTAQVGDNAAAVALSNDCFDLSDNFIEIIRSSPDGGTVNLPDGSTTATVCVGDGVDDILDFAHTTGSGARYAYVITDDNNNILGIPPGNSQNFEGAGVGVCRVWGLSYTGNIIAEAGDNAAAVDLSDDCFELSSNFIEVRRETCFNDPGNPVFSLDQTNEQILASLQLAPNPVVEKLKVSFNNEALAQESAILQVYNLNGQLQFERQIGIDQGINTAELAVERLIPGIYFVRLQSSSIQISKRFVKQ